MAQHRQRERAQVLFGHVIAPCHQRARLGREAQELRRAHAGAVAHVAAHDFRRDRLGRARGAHQLDRVAAHLRGQRHLPHQPLESA